MPIYNEICALVSEKKIFKELICIIIRKTAHLRGGLIYWRSKFVLAILIDGHLMTIYANLHSNLSISFRGEDFKIFVFGCHSNQNSAWIYFIWAIFIEDHPRTIYAKF